MLALGYHFHCWNSTEQCRWTCHLDQDRQQEDKQCTWSHTKKGGIASYNVHTFVTVLCICECLLMQLHQLINRIYIAMRLVKIIPILSVQQVPHFLKPSLGQFSGDSLYIYIVHCTIQQAFQRLWYWTYTVLVPCHLKTTMKCNSAKDSLKVNNHMYSVAFNFDVCRTLWRKSNTPYTPLNNTHVRVRVHICVCIHVRPCPSVSSFSTYPQDVT